jgi:hypothetical protein
MINISGLVNSVLMADYTTSGVFSSGYQENAAVPAGGQSYNRCSLTFDASRVLGSDRIANEFRVATVSVWYGISY